jgi:hypothetical protein
MFFFFKLFFKKDFKLIYFNIFYYFNRLISKSRKNKSDIFLKEKYFKKQHLPYIQEDLLNDFLKCVFLKKY